MFQPIKRQTSLPHQESVWDYPRPLRVESTSKCIPIVFNGVKIVETTQAMGVLEMSHPSRYGN